MSVRVLVVDDHPLVRSGVRLICAQTDDLQVVAEAGNGLEALTQVGEATPDVVLMDIQMPRMDGVEATRRIVQASPHPQVIMLTVHGDGERVFASLRAGATGYLLKDALPHRLITAVRTVAAGRAMIAPEATRVLIEALVQGPPIPELAVRAGLSEREVEVWRLVARGLSDEDIGKQLHIAPVTVRTHVRNVLRKTGARHRVDAVIRAYESGLLLRGLGA